MFNPNVDTFATTAIQPFFAVFFNLAFQFWGKFLIAESEISSQFLKGRYNIVIFVTDIYFNPLV